MLQPFMLSPDAHKYWTKAYFALKPIQLSDDKKCLDVEFYWMPRCNHSAAVDILTSPESSEGRSDAKLLHFPTERLIYSGQTFSLTTDDTEKHPLPHPALLEMQWILQRVAAMSGAAEICDDFDNDDDDAIALLNECESCREDESDLGDEIWEGEADT